jgi:hypothetical protein
MKQLQFLIIALLVLILSSCNLGTGSETEITISLLQGQDTVEIHTEWVDAGAKLYVGDTEYIATTTDTVDTSKLGLYEVVYGYEYAGELYGVTRYVIVVDQTSPVITLTPGVDTIQLGDTWEDAGATVTDNSLEELTVTVSGEIDPTTLGTYKITYTATDSSGNTTEVDRYVDVIE